MADGFFTCSTGSTGAPERVAAQFSYLNAYTDKTLSATLSAVSNIAKMELPSFVFSIDPFSTYDIPILGYTPAPTLDPVDMRALDAQLPPNPVDLPRTTLDDLGPLPATPPDPPTPTFDAAPTAYNPQFQAPPTITIPVAPQLIDYTGSIPQPTLRTITLPPVPDINLDDLVFDVPPPTFNVAPPDARDFAYTEPDYVVQILNFTNPVIRSMLAGNSGIALNIESALWARMYDDIDNEGVRAVADATEEWASRGFGMPSGVVNKMIRKARQASQSERNKARREVAIRTQDVLLDQLKFAVVQSIAYEDLFMRLFGDQQNRKLQAARFAVDIAIAVFNARVAEFQAQAQVYKVQADVFLARIQAELAKVQVYSEEIKAQQLIGELNEQDIRIYLARLQAIETNVKAYVAATEGYKNLLDGGRLQLEQAKLLIDEELAKLNASELQVKIWTEKAQEQQIVQQSFQTRAQTYLAAVQGYEARARVDIEKLRVDIANREAVTQRYEALLTGFTALVNYAKTKADLTIANNQQKVQAYTADTEGKSAYNQTVVAKVNAVNQALIERVKILLENSDINKRNLVEGVKIVLQQLTTISEVLSSLASSSLSAVHVGAQIGDSSAVSSSCNFNTSQTIGS